MSTLFTTDEDELADDEEEEPHVADSTSAGDGEAVSAGENGSESVSADSILTTGGAVLMNPSPEGHLVSSMESDGHNKQEL